ncbi:MAG: EboA domain-containing protein [Elusimicrobia bacterium]|nr:EboA domain-containing protein [Elusimicrobiota bacterium]
MNTSLLPQLWLCLDRRVDASVRSWLEGAEDKPFAAMGAAYASVPRHVGRGPIVATPGERLALGACGVPAGLAEWRVDDLARAALLLGWGSRLTAADLESLVHSLYKAGDPAARAAVLRCLALTPEPWRFLSIAFCGADARERQCFEAVACANTYPAAHFGDERFSDMILRALAMETRLERVVGLASRVTPSLRRAVAEFARERREAGLGVPEDAALLEAAVCDTSTPSPT